MNLYGMRLASFHQENLTNLKQTHEDWHSLVMSPGSQAVLASLRPFGWPTPTEQVVNEAKRLRNRARRIRQGRLS